MGGMITRIIDNLQVTIRDIHIRIENKDEVDETRSFSLGIVLRGADLFTTDEKW